MVLNLINIIQVGIVWVLIFPHIIYSMKSAEGMIRCGNKVINFIAQIGRYASMLLMVLPIGIWEFGFPSDGNMIIYFVANILLLAAYIFAWVLYFKKQSFGRGLATAILEAAVFFTCGFLLEHWFLVGSSLIFASGNILVNVIRNKEAKADD